MSSAHEASIRILCDDPKVIGMVTTPVVVINIIASAIKRQNMSFGS
jgi:hypothetical protein